MPSVVGPRGGAVASANNRRRVFRRAFWCLLVILAAVVALAVSLGIDMKRDATAAGRQDRFIAAARQGALTLANVDFARIDSDIGRILDLSTGGFKADFEQRSRAFANLVKQVQSKSSATVTDSGLESQNGQEATVLVALTVKTQTAQAPDGRPRAWRMRITVQEIAPGDVKVSEVELVP